MLLGLLSEKNGVAAVLLRNAGASLAAARHKVAEVVNFEAGTTTTDVLPLTPRAQRSIERAGRYSRQKREPEVTAEHVLFGVLDVEGLACQVLRGLNVDIGNLRDALAATTTVSTLALPGKRPAAVKAVAPRCPWCRAVLEGSLAEAVLSTRGDEQHTNVSVVFCTACGATLGIVRPK